MVPSKTGTSQPASSQAASSGLRANTPTKSSPAKTAGKSTVECCHLFKNQANGTIHAVKCCLCKPTVYLACLNKEFKNNTGEGLKNKTEWIFEFLNANNFCPICTSCAAKASKNVSDQHATHDDHADIAKEMSSMKNSICDLESKVSDVLAMLLAVDVQREIPLHPYLLSLIPLNRGFVHHTPIRHQRI